MADDCKYIIDRANLHYVRKQASEFLCDLNERVSEIENHPQGGIVLDYLYTDGATGSFWDTEAGTPDGVYWDTVIGTPEGVEWGNYTGELPAAGYISVDAQLFEDVTVFNINKLTQNLK